MYGDALTTRARIKSRLQITATEFDAVIDNIILAVTARIEQMCGRRFIYGTYTNELHDGGDLYGTRRNFLILKNAPVTSITTVEYKAGTNSSPNWTALTEDDYDVDLASGILRGNWPRGMQNVRVTYVGGFSGYSLGINNYWIFNVVPTGSLNGVNLDFTLPEAADQIVVYADGMREAASNVTFTAGGTTFSLAAGRAPSSTLYVDYLRTNQEDDAEAVLPADLVEACEQIVVRIFKRRDNDGRTSESFNESSVTWSDSFMSAEHKATIRNYRRSYEL